MRWTAFSIVGLGSTAYAASSISQQCVGKVCYSMNIPSSTSSSGSGDVYYQISGPTSNGWIAMGTGSMMKGSNMFVIYTSSSGSNVTLSPRTATGEVMPTFDSSIQATLLDGSGVSNGVMTANIKCSNCDPTTSTFIYAYYSGSAVNSDSQSATIQQHQMNSFGNLGLSVSSATGGSDSNPFVSTSSGSGTSSSSAAGTSGTPAPSSTSSSSSACATNTAPATSTPAGTLFGFSVPGGGGFGPFTSSMFKRASTNNGCNDGGSSSSSGSSNGIASDGSSNRRLSPVDIKKMAHGICAGLSFAVLYPLGAIVFRLFSFPGLIWVHAGIQILTNILFIVGFVLGVSLANEIGTPFSVYHPAIGIVLLCLVIIQPILGHMHHVAYKRVGKRTYWSYGHLFVGRLLITLGIINGGLGFMLADNTSVGQTVYAVVAAIIYAVYLLAIIIGERRRAKMLAMPPKYAGSPGSTSPRAEYAGHGGEVFPMDIQMERFPPPMPGNHRGDGYTRQLRWSRQ